jgi:hypothetical protein
MMISLAALSNHGAWGIALAIGLVAALAVAALLVVLVRTVMDIDKSVAGLLEVAGKVAGNTANIPQLEATAPVLALIVGEAVVQDGYMNATTLTILSVLLALVIVVVLAAALILIRAGLESASKNLATLAEALEGVESDHLRPLEPAVRAINAQFDVIVGALPGIASKAAVVADRRPK